MTAKYKQDWHGPRPSPVEFVSQFDIPVEPAVQLRPYTAPRDAWTPRALHPPRLLVWAVSIRPDSMPVARECPRPERCADAPVPFHVIPLTIPCTLPLAMGSSYSLDPMPGHVSLPCPASRHDKGEGLPRPGAGQSTRASQRRSLPCSTRARALAPSDKLKRKSAFRRPT